MAQWKCRQCGVEATSKCPWERSVFLVNQQLAEWEMILPIHVQPRDKELPEDSIDQGTVVLRIKVWKDQEPVTKLEHVISILTRAKEANLLEALVCPHDSWEMISGEKCTLGHTREEHNRIQEVK